MNYKKGLWFLVGVVMTCSVYAASNPASTGYVAAKIAALQAEIMAMLGNTG